MKICLILEGCYPYVFGGVSTWVHQYILSKPEHEFVILTIAADDKDKGKFVYEIPQNVVQIKETFLNTEENEKIKISKMKYSEKFLNGIRNLIIGNKVIWNNIFYEINSSKWNVESFFKSSSYLKLIKSICKNELKNNGFLEIFYGMKSMLKPLLELLSTEIPEADIYHSASTGYAGILRCNCKTENSKTIYFD